MGIQRRSNPALPAVILLLFLGLLVFLVVTRKHASQPNSTTQNNPEDPFKPASSHHA